MPLVWGSRLVLQTDAASTHLFNGPDTNTINLVFVKSGNFVPAHPSYGQTFDQFCGGKIVQSGKLSLPTLTLERVMTDKELLELAAKAAGIDARRLPDAWPNRFDDDQWNPLTDDGDALRLAVKLGIELEAVPFGGRAVIRDDDDCGEYFDVEGDDPYAATRRAIVRAAAGIGKSL